MAVSGQAKPPKKPQQWYTVSDLATQLQVSTTFVRRRIWAGELKAHRLGRVVRVSHTELLRWIEKGN